MQLQIQPCTAQVAGHTSDKSHPAQLRGTSATILAAELYRQSNSDMIWWIDHWNFRTTAINFSQNFMYFLLPFVKFFLSNISKKKALIDTSSNRMTCRIFKCLDIKKTIKMEVQMMDIFQY